MKRLITNNRYFAIFSLLAALFAVGCEDKVITPLPPPGPGPVLLVANDGGGAGYLSMIDLDTREVRPGVAGLGRQPNSIIYYQNKLYILNSGSQNVNVLAISDSNYIQPLDTADVSFGGNRSPGYAALSNSGSLYISNFSDNSVSVVNISNMGDPLTIENVGQGPQGILAYQDKIYVCISGYRISGFDSVGVVAIISTVSTRVIKRINVGMNPQYLIKDNNNQIHVVCTGNYDDIGGEIYKISANADTITQVINIGGQPGDIAIAGQFAYLANWGDGTNGFLYRYNLSTGQILNGPLSPIIVSKGAGRLVARSNGSVYVSCYNADKVDEVFGTVRRNSWSVGDGPGPMIIIEH